MSIHEVKVVRITDILPHPNADALEIVPVWDYQCAVRKGTFKVGDLAAYVEPDYKVPLDRPEFAFLSKPGKTRTKHRIAVRRLRGLYSQGLLVAPPAGAVEGDNVLDILGVTRYEPQEETMVKGANAEKGPDFVTPKYDLENYKKYHRLLRPGEKVIYTSKIHGTNARFVFSQDRMWCGSRTQWKVKPGTMVNSGQNQFGVEEQHEVKQNAWWLALSQNPWIETWCRAHPDAVLYGEVYGPGVQAGFHYGKAPGEFGFAVFDVFKDGQWVSNEAFRTDPDYKDLLFVPTLFRGKHDPTVLTDLAEQTETYNKAGHIREGVVIKLQTERFDPEIGRVALKHVSNQYLEVK